MRSRRYAALLDAYRKGVAMHQGYQHVQAERWKGTKNEGYVSRPAQRINEAIEAFTPSEDKIEELEAMLQLIWTVAVHGWASVPGKGFNWRLYVAGLLGFPNEL